MKLRLQLEDHLLFESKDIIPSFIHFLSTTKLQAQLEIKFRHRICSDEQSLKDPLPLLHLDSGGGGQAPRILDWIGLAKPGTLNLDMPAVPLSWETCRWSILCTPGRREIICILVDRWSIYFALTLPLTLRAPKGTPSIPGSRDSVWGSHCNPCRVVKRSNSIFNIFHYVFWCAVWLSDFYITFEHILPRELETAPNLKVLFIFIEDVLYL